MLVGGTIVYRHGNGNMPHGVDGAHRAEWRTFDFAVHDLAFIGERSGIKLH